MKPILCVWQLSMQFFRGDTDYPTSIGISVVAETAQQAVVEAKTCVGRNATCSGLSKGAEIIQ